MNQRQRLETVFAGKKPDRPPALGGWIASPYTLLKLTGATAGQYNADPEGVAIQAYKMLGMDGLIGVFVTKDADIYRCVDERSYIKADDGRTFEDVVREVEEMPSAAEYEKSFDFVAEYAAYRSNFIERQTLYGEMLSVPANWNAGARAAWYSDFGYENFFLLIGLRPDLGAKLFQIGGARGRCQSMLIAKAIEEGLHPKAMLLGEDICTQRGPMISTKFLNEYYAPALEYGLEPLLAAGCRPVWHSDGDVRELIPMLISCGIQGFQGFQPECGMHIEDIVKLRTRDGGKMLVFGAFAVTTELPVMTTAQVRERARYYADVCKDEADYVLFTSNTINPDIPLDNLLAMYDENRKISY